MENVMKQVEGGVCAAKGFSANGLNCGLNPNKEKNDLALIYSERRIWQPAATMHRQSSPTVRMPTPVTQMEKKKRQRCVHLQLSSLAFQQTI